MLRVHVVHALDARGSVSPAQLSQPASATRTFKPPTILDARANRFLLPNRSPVRLLSPARDSMPFTIVYRSRGEKPRGCRREHA